MLVTLALDIASIGALRFVAVASKFDQSGSNIKQTSIVDNIHNNQSKPLDHELQNQRKSKHEGALRAHP